MAIKQCLNCKKDFKVYGKRIETAKFCSHSCQKEYSSNPDNYDKWQYFVCQYCGKEFRRTQGQVTTSLNSGEQIKYCSRDCKMKAETINTEDLPCANCGKIITLPKNRIDRAKNNFCSIKCRDELRTKNIPYTIKICKICGKEFEVKNSDLKRYRNIRTFECCSNDCKNHAEYVDTKCDFCNKDLHLLKSDYDQSKKHYCNVECMGKDKINSIEVECSRCKKKFLAQQSRIKYYDKLFCSRECRIKTILNYEEYSFNTPKLNEEYRRLSNRLRSVSVYLNWRNQVIELRGNKCIKCSSDENIQVHHSKYSLYQICKENDFDYDKVIKDFRFLDPENGEVLCKKCHMNYHFN